MLFFSFLLLANRLFLFIIYLVLLFFSFNGNSSIWIYSFFSLKCLFFSLSLVVIVLRFSNKIFWWEKPSNLWFIFWDWRDWFQLFLLLIEFLVGFNFFWFNLLFLGFFLNIRIFSLWKLRLLIWENLW